MAAEVAIDITKTFPGRPPIMDFERKSFRGAKGSKNVSDSERRIGGEKRRARPRALIESN